MMVTRDIDWAAIGAYRHELGLEGERIVRDEEIRRLKESNRHDLAKLVKNVDRERGEHPGYDIASYSNDGGERFIEVKATSGTLHDPFDMSANELSFLEGHQDATFVYRVSIPNGSSEVKIAILSARTVLAGARTPIEYHAEPKSAQRG
jgi:hypothetical protein